MTCAIFRWQSPWLVHNFGMSNTLTLSRTSPPLQIRLAISKDESKDYVLLVTKQGRLLLNKKVEPANQTMTTQ